MQEISTAETNLNIALQMRHAAEMEPRNAKEVFIDPVHRFLASELDGLRQQGEQDAGQWPAGELSRWIAEKLQAKINRLELASQRGMGEELQKVRGDAQRLQTQSEELTTNS